MQVHGPHACGAYWHARAARATMPGWLVMTTWPTCGRWLRYLDGARPSTTRIWVDLVVPVVIQAAAGAGHWAAGRRQRALAEWAGAAGFGLVAWGLGTEAATAAEVREDFQRQLRDLARERGIDGPGYPQAGDSRGPPDRAVLPLVRPCFPGSFGGPQRAVAPAPPAAADGARDRLRSPEPSRMACCGRPGPCSGAGRGWPSAQPWSQPDR